MNLDNSHYFTIEEVNKVIKNTLDQYVGFVRVKGEISSLTFHNSGHIYFSLKDPKAQLDGIIFKNIVKPEFLSLSKGQTVYALGTINYYVKTGKTSFQCYYISITEEPGIAYKNLSVLKEKLEKEGLFEPQKKLFVPSLLNHLIIITSLTGAALTDFLSLIKGQTFKETKITIIESAMQGEQTTSQIIKALEIAKILKGVDVVLITRGGGAYEDLWEFNNEQLCRYIAHYSLPVISAIGHEQDYTLLDFVSHTRYATPSAAAYGLFTYKQAMMNHLSYLHSNLHYYYSFFLQKTESLLEHSQFLLQHYMDRILNDHNVKIQSLYEKLSHTNPTFFLKKGYVKVSAYNGKAIKEVPTKINKEDTLTIETLNGRWNVKVIQKLDQ